MSRIGKKPAPIPEGVEVKVADGVVTVKGKGGELSLTLTSDVTAVAKDGLLTVATTNDSRQAKLMWGTTQRNIMNMCTGVTTGFSKKLILTGVGYRANLKGSLLVLQLGFSHDIDFPVPKDIKIVCEDQTTIVVSGIDKQKVGQVAAKIRSYRTTEPYKGKGVKYDDEYVERKEGKKK
ncbi:MAG: 50S ribosomal protein L6 [Alphaproteobacteria bacterium]